MAIGDSRELREKRGRKLDDGAVLHEHSLVTAEVQGGEFPRLDVLIDLEGNHMAEAAQIEKGEEMEWLLEDRNTFVLRRIQPKKSVVKGKMPLT